MTVKVFSVTVPLLFKSAAPPIHHWLWGTIYWTLTTITYLQDMFFPHVSSPLLLVLFGEV